MKATKPSEIATNVGVYLKAGDLEGILKMFHPDCTLVFPKGAEPKRGLEAVREAFEPFLGARPTLVSNVTGELIHDDLALLTAEWRLEDDDGRVLDAGTSMEVARRSEDGSWVYFMDCPYGPPSLGEE